ncbi:MAG: FAD-binding oxidoreductase [Actinomycetota bacterium]|nr:FAD-binding oxidoreductase [Actinomycetota bacterium]
MNVPFWLVEKPEPVPVRALRGAPDVAVVGGGITGCSCALTLARAGMRVRLYEARALAGGASGRNGGFALRGGAMAYDQARTWLGADRAARYWRLTESYLERMREVGGAAISATGSLRLAADAEERDELWLEYEALREDGFEAEWRDALAPPLAGRFPGAIFHPVDAALHPARFVRLLAAAAAGAGVEIREHHRVTLDELDVEHVVVATDGYPSGLLGELEGLIIPVRGQMIATEPLSEQLFGCPHYGRHGFDYWQQLPDGRVLAGGFRDWSLDSEFTTEEVTTPTIQGALETFVADLTGRPPRITHRWAGIFGLVLDFLPVVGPLPGSARVWVAGGYSGHGNVLGFACGDLVARALLGDRHPLLDLFEPARLLAARAGADA